MKFTTSRGITIELKAIQTLLEKFEASARLPKIPDELKELVGDAMPAPEAPTYDVKTITGRIEKHVHDDKTTKTPEQKAAWEKYQKDLRAYNDNYTLRQKKLLFLHGMSVEFPTDDSWVKAQEELGITVPTDPTERKLHYVETEVIGGVGDYVEIMRLCTTMGLPEEQRRLAEELFRREMGRYTAEGVGDSNGQVDGNGQV